jgi:hypothetical protein
LYSVWHKVIYRRNLPNGCRKLKWWSPHTWLWNAHTVHGYEIVRRDKNLKGRCDGGVCSYIRSCINFSVRYDLEFDELENLCISINKPKSKPFLIVTWYRPPNSVVEKFNHLEITLLGKLDAENIEYYLMCEKTWISAKNC